MAQLVEAPWYKLEDRGFDSRFYVKKIDLATIFPLECFNFEQK
jgi:hypothetical protein